MSNIGTKIVVVGVSASGKSTFARALAEKTKLPVKFMDEIMWKPGWKYIGDDAVVQKLKDMSAGSSWIIEGYISSGARAFLFERADTIVYLDYPPIVGSLRYIKRWWQHRKNPRPELPGSPDTFSWNFLKLVWTKGEAITLNELLAKVDDQSKILRFTSPKEARNFLDNL